VLHPAASGCLTFVQQKRDTLRVAPRMGRPPLAPDSKHYGFRLPESVMRAVDSYARRMRITRSEAIRLLLERGLNRINLRKKTR
jgi:hypothetical protein